MKIITLCAEVSGLDEAARIGQMWDSLPDVADNPVCLKSSRTRYANRAETSQNLGKCKVRILVETRCKRQGLQCPSVSTIGQSINTMG